MTEWKKYNGSLEQIEEIKNAKDGFLCRNADRIISGVLVIIGNSVAIKHNVFVLCHLDNLRDYLFSEKTDSYFICNPHPLADMICRHVRTGQPVYWRLRNSIIRPQNWSCNFIPWNSYDTYEFSFTPFED